MNPINWIADQVTLLLTFLAGWVENVVVLPDSLSSWAVAIILVGILVKIVTWPLNATQMRSMKAMQELQPKLKEIQAKHKDDREKLAQAQMELYKEHGVNPFGGCLPLLIQMPILFGLYRAIFKLGPPPSGTGQLVGEHFLWIRDLGLCEPNPLCDATGGPFGLPIPILLIVMTVAQMAYQKWMTPPSTGSDANAQAMQSVFKWMPLMFAFIFASLPSGLVLYYTVFTVANIVQQLLMRRGQPKPGADTAGLTSGSDSKGGSGASTKNNTKSERAASSQAAPAKEKSSHGRNQSRRQRKRKRTR
jgi:YidC/Oxa1 family membrane protein insertase